MTHFPVLSYTSASEILELILLYHIPKPEKKKLIKIPEAWKRPKPFGRSLPRKDDISISIFLNTLYITVLHNQFCLQKYQGCNVTRFKEFLFEVEEIYIGEKGLFFRYKPFNNPSICLGKDTNCTLSLVKSGTDKVQRPCLFERDFIKDRKRG